MPRSRTPILRPPTKRPMRRIDTGSNNAALHVVRVVRARPTNIGAALVAVALASRDADALCLVDPRGFGPGTMAVQGPKGADGEKCDGKDRLHRGSRLEVSWVCVACFCDTWKPGNGVQDASEMAEWGSHFDLWSVDRILATLMQGQKCAPR